MSKRVKPLVGERKKGEGKKAVIAGNDYLRMGAGRSLAKLIRKYAESMPDSAPTTNLIVAKRWSARYDWQARAEAYDAEREAEKDARRKEIMEAGLALDYERVSKLINLTEFLESQIAYEPESESEEGEGDADGMTDDEFTAQLRREQGDPVYQRPLVWVRDYKQIGAGEFAEKVEIYRFNAALISEYRGALDDLAKETGGRRQKIDADHVVHMAVTTDDMAQARNELDEWKQERSKASKQSGSNAP